MANSTDDGYGRCTLEALKPGHKYLGRDGESTYLILDVESTDGWAAVACLETGVISYPNKANTKLRVCQNGWLRIEN